MESGTIRKDNAEGVNVKKKLKKSKDAPRPVDVQLVPRRLSPLNEKAVSEAVVWINQKVEDTLEKGFAGLVEIGQYVFKKFFNGKAEQVSFRGRQKESTFQSLASHPDLKISKTWLHNAVYLAIQEEQLLASGVEVDARLSSTHRVELLRVKSMKDKKKLLEEIRDKHLSVRQLHERIDQVVGKMLSPPATEKAERGFRIPRPIVMLGALDLERILSEKRLEKLNGRQLDSYQKELEKARETIGKMLRAIERARPQ